jgi:hypothetical protein
MKRVLMLTLEALPAGSGRQLVVASAHLSAGDAPDQRVRQLEGAFKVLEKKFGVKTRKVAPPPPPPPVHQQTSFTDWHHPAADPRTGGATTATTAGTATVDGTKKAKKQKAAEEVELSLSHVPLVLCGDFNSQPQQASRHFLLRKRIDADFKDPIAIQVEVTPKVRTHCFDLCDAYDHAYALHGRARPNTMIVRQIFDLCRRGGAEAGAEVGGGTEVGGGAGTGGASAPAAPLLVVPPEVEAVYTAGFVNAVRKMFQRFAVPASDEVVVAVDEQQVRFHVPHSTSWLRKPSLMRRTL